MNGMNPECVWPVGALLGEGPLWHAPHAALYFVDIKGSRIHRYEPGSDGRTSWDVDGQPGFLVPQAGGGFVCGAGCALWTFDPHAHSEPLARLMEVEDPASGNRINDGFVDASGRLWFGTMCDAEDKPTGALYRLDERGLSRQDEGYVVTNGPAASPEGRTLYHTNTFDRIIWRFDVAPDGTLSNKRPFVRTDGPGWPDGMAVDEDGFVWVAFFGGWRIDRYSPAGAKTDTIRFPCANITKPAFGGHDGRTVYVSSAAIGLTAEQLAGQPLAGGLFRFESPVAGLPQWDFSARFAG